MAQRNIARCGAEVSLEVFGQMYFSLNESHTLMAAFQAVIGISTQKAPLTPARTGQPESTVGAFCQIFTSPWNNLGIKVLIMGDVRKTNTTFQLPHEAFPLSLPLYIWLEGR